MNKETKKKKRIKTSYDVVSDALVRKIEECERLSAEVERLKEQLAGVKKPGVETRPFKNYNEFDQEQREWKPK